MYVCIYIYAPYIYIYICAKIAAIARGLTLASLLLPLGPVQTSGNRFHADLSSHQIKSRFMGKVFTSCKIVPKKKKKKRMMHLVAHNRIAKRQWQRGASSGLALQKWQGLFLSRYVPQNQQKHNRHSDSECYPHNCRKLSQPQWPWTLM